MIASYRDLVVWNKAMELVVAVYAATASMQSEERFGLRVQLQRAAVSIPSNIAEGHARHSQREFAHFLSVSIGSLAELATQIELAGRLNLLKEPTTSRLLESAEHLRAMLLNLLTSIRARTGIREEDPTPYLTEPTQ